MVNEENMQKACDVFQRAYIKSNRRETADFAKGCKGNLNTKTQFRIIKESPGVEWRTKAARLLYKFGEWDGQKFILVENSDDATEDELDEFDSLTPYRPLLDIESHRKESLNYLNKVQPNMSKDDKEWASLRFIFKCSACDRYYPTWWISKKDWQNSFAGVVQKGIFDFWGDSVDSPRIFLCKECFEEIEQNQPKYFTINQYIAHRLVAEMGAKKENTAEYKRILSQIWDLPAA